MALLLLGLLPAAVIAADGAAEQPPAPLPPVQPVATSDSGSTAPANYRLRPGDLVRFDVFNQPDLTLVTRVASDGPITVPLIGDVANPMGREVGDLCREIKSRLEAEYLRHATVTATIVEYAPMRIYVLGSVARQDAIPLSPFQRTTALQAIGLAGGFQADADLLGVVVIRDDPGHPGVKISLPVAAAANPSASLQDVVMEPGDLINVPRQGVRRFYVMGKVKNVGAFPLSNDENVTVSKGISLAGGFDTFSVQDKVQVIRAGKPVSVVDVRRILAGEPGAVDPVVGAGDTINVPDSRF